MYFALIRLYLNQQSVKYFIVLRDTHRNVHNVYATLSHNAIMSQNLYPFALCRCLQSYCTYPEHIIYIRSLNNDVDCDRCYHLICEHELIPSVTINSVHGNNSNESVSNTNNQNYFHSINNDNTSATASSLALQKFTCANDSH